MGVGYQHQSWQGGALERCPQVVGWLTYTSCGHHNKEQRQNAKSQLITLVMSWLFSFPRYCRALQYLLRVSMTSSYAVRTTSPFNTQSSARALICLRIVSTLSRRESGKSLEMVTQLSEGVIFKV